LEKGRSARVPAIVLFEMWYGIKKSGRPKQNADNLLEFLTLDLTPWPFDSADAEEAGNVRAALQRAGTPIGPYDILIASQARRRNATLATASAQEFARVPGLKVEDWAAA
jgi:tRNA(fMet)-specific endonuclease VapC